MEDDLDFLNFVFLSAEFKCHYTRVKLWVVGVGWWGVVHRGMPMQRPEEGTGCGDVRHPGQLCLALDVRGVWGAGGRVWGLELRQQAFLPTELSL